MGQHYIPQYYLKGFSTSSDASLIWVYEKGKNRASLLPIQSIANEKRRWPEQNEIYLEHKVESPANSVINRIRNHQPITEDDKQKLSAYMVVMLLRVPRGLQRVKEESPIVTNEIFEKLEMKIHSLKKEHPENTVLLSKRLDELPGIRHKWESFLPKDVWYNMLTPDTLPQVLTIISDMNWIFLTSQKKHAFITSDNPVFFFEQVGLANSEAQVFFPISSNIALFISWKKSLKNLYIRVKDSTLPQINKRIASTATKYIYHSENNQGIVSLVNKDKLKFMKLV
jgi:hypothetical protein